MASQQFELPDIGIITIVKRAASRNIRLSIRSDGTAMVSIPRWATYRSGLAFAKSKAEWLKEHLVTPITLQDGQAIGKNHRLEFKPTRGLKTPRTLVGKTTITVRYPISLQASDTKVQEVAATACIRALRSQAEEQLPSRLKDLSEQYGFSYSSVQIKRLKGRWGSCDSHQNIVLNLYLMQLPWTCIDYVLLHELTHTEIMRHGPPFWGRMNQLIPDLSLRRTIMKRYQPVLQSGMQSVQ